MKGLWLSFCLLFFTALLGQAPLDWSDFENGISWKKSVEDSSFPGFLEADFSKRLEQYEGKEVSVIGFLIVLDGAQSIFMLSKNPMAECFFCGNGGPETVSQINFKGEHSFQMDDLISVTGILRLNRKDPTRCYYLLEEAEAFGI
ncbi:MAG: hypothetical protein ACFB0A_07780 [Croceivirga sp.]